MDNVNILSDKNESENNPISNNYPYKKKRFKNFKISYRLVAIAIMCSVALLLGGLFAWLIYGSPKLPHSQNVQIVRVSSPQGGSIKFTKPANFESSGGDTSTQPLQAFQLIERTRNKTKTSGYLFVSATSLTPSVKKYLNKTNDYLTKSPSSAEHQIAIAPITSFVRTMLFLNTKIALYNPSPFKTSNIKSNAWQFELSATDGEAGAPDFRGKAIYAWTEKATYYYALAVTPGEWEKNISTWQVMIESIKLE